MTHELSDGSERRGGCEEARTPDAPHDSCGEVLQAAIKWRATRSAFIQVPVRQWRQWDAARDAYNAAKRALDDAVARYLGEPEEEGR